MVAFEEFDEKLYFYTVISTEDVAKSFLLMNHWCHYEFRFYMLYL